VAGRGNFPTSVATGTYSSNSGPVLEMLAAERIRGNVEREPVLLIIVSYGPPVGNHLRDGAIRIAGVLALLSHGSHGTRITRITRITRTDGQYSSDLKEPPEEHGEAVSRT
jgi:hypothetical protein